MYAPPEPPPPGPAGSDVNARSARYSYLVGRLRNRQITMEEATELFNLMQVTLSRSEAGRLAALAAANANRSTSPPRLPPPPPGTPTLGTTDDLLLVGLLAMGTGAGLVAALTKRVQELTPPGTSVGHSDATTSTQ
jgi:hypothetical protein